ncbi:MAG TPA: glycosyl hydrolase family 8 [Puia sp.]|nr:glycosyl hydrolase family 8 [Puia sp.]
MRKRFLTIFIVTFLANKCFPQLANYSFPQHCVYFQGTIRPNHITQEKIDQQVLDFYKGWKKQYVHTTKDGNQAYVFFDEEGTKFQSVSEGQGYGMIIEALLGGADPDAKKTFDQLLNYVWAHPSNPQTTLMAWSQLRDMKDKNIKEATSATDGDMDIAYALLLADAQWGSGGKYNYKDSAEKMIGYILRDEINGEFFSILLSDAVKPDSEDFYDTRASDFMPLHFKVFENATGDLRWRKVVDRNYELFMKMQNRYSADAGLVPDFITHINHIAKPAKPNYLESKFDGYYNYNACRVPMRVAMDYLLTGDKRSYKMMGIINRWIKETTSGNPDNISAGYTLGGDDIKGRKFEALSFICPFAVASMIDSTNQLWLNNIWDYLTGFKLAEFDYYDNTIKMLCMLIISGNYWIPPTHALSLRP